MTPSLNNIIRSLFFYGVEEVDEVALVAGILYLFIAILFCFISLFAQYIVSRYCHWKSEFGRNITRRSSNYGYILFIYCYIVLLYYTSSKQLLIYLFT